MCFKKRLWHGLMTTFNWRYFLTFKFSLAQLEIELNQRHPTVWRRDVVLVLVQCDVWRSENMRRTSVSKINKGLRTGSATCSYKCSVLITSICTNYNCDVLTVSVLRVRGWKWGRWPVGSVLSNFLRNLRQLSEVQSGDPEQFVFFR